jgi:hypothetical protein
MIRLHEVEKFHHTRHGATGPHFTDNTMRNTLKKEQFPSSAPMRGK